MWHLFSLDICVTALRSRADCAPDLMIISLSAMLVRFALSNTGTFANRQYRTADLARRNLLFAVVWQGRRAIRLGVFAGGGKEGNTPVRQALLFFPRRPIGAAAALGRIELRATKSVHELLRVRLLLEAVDVKPLAVVMERVASRAERQISTELVYVVVAAPLADPRRKLDLLRPAAVNSRRRQFAFAPHARTAA